MDMKEHLIEIHEQAKKWVEEIIPFIKESILTKLTVDTKSSANDLVTNVDKAVESHFRAKIQETYPTHGIIGEEHGYEGVKGSFDSIWVIDPIDGTTNFVKQKDYFCVLVSYYEKDIGELAYFI
ncbi:inositol monophosphatase family protein [Sporosarcina thermotolerans]|uniref:inositol monophosphatase family protein n=1 Tax=Sporosarcina thermotolerans TaxID=633404 RepID=UPI0024BCF8CA|nr:inositol monophosphatase family protein [Sporosarcina thermotolerans]WHT49494.1 inositol monophosphatase family protein [Sporosarcina thermotolerans]